MSDIRSSCKGADTQKKRKVNVILSKESHNASIECKTLFVSIWDAVMEMTAVGKCHFSCDIRKFKNIKLPITPPPPNFFIAYNFKVQFLRTSACVCRTSEIVSLSSCRASAILNYFCPLAYVGQINFNFHANSMDPDQTAPYGAV